MFGIIAISYIPVVIHACITVHAYQSDCILNGGDIVSAQMFDNGKRVCNGGKSHLLAKDSTTFCIDGCDKGYSLCIKNTLTQVIGGRC